MAEEKEQETRGIVRVVGRDLRGEKKLESELTRIKGISVSMARAIIQTAGLESDQKVGVLSDKDVEKLENVLENPLENGLPKWMLNRRKDYEKGDNLHLLGGDIEMTERNDISREKNIRSRRGIRHQRGLPVRGQKTKSTGRKGMSVGVEREKLREEEGE